MHGMGPRFTAVWETTQTRSATVGFRSHSTTPTGGSEPMWWAVRVTARGKDGAWRCVCGGGGGAVWAAGSYVRGGVRRVGADVIHVIRIIRCDGRDAHHPLHGNPEGESRIRKSEKAGVLSGHIKFG